MRLPLANRQVFKELIRFGIVGIANTALTLLIILILMHVANFPYTVANLTGYLAGFLNSFLWNKLWTFRSQGNWVKEFLFFILAFLVSYLFQFGVLLLLVEYLRWNATFSQLFSMGFYTIANFFINKFLTFR